jgi:hypothetical protein
MTVHDLGRNGSAFDVRANVPATTDIDTNRDRQIYRHPSNYGRGCVITHRAVVVYGRDCWARQHERIELIEIAVIFLRANDLIGSPSSTAEFR